MEEKDNIKELFEKQLAKHQVEVRPELWQGVASQIGAASTVGGGMSLFAKLAIGIGGAAAVATTVFLTRSSSSENENAVNLPSEQTTQVELIDATKEHTTYQESANEENGVEEESAAVDEPFVSPESPVYVTEFVDCVEVIQEAFPVLTIETVQPISVVETTTTTEALDKGAQASNEDSTPHAPVTENHGDQKVEETFTENQLEDEMVAPVKMASITKVPNIFTPNGDRDNDEFFIEYEGVLFDYQLVVMNQRNQVVYKSSNPDFRWDGMSISGEPTPDGTYYFILTARDSANNPINQYGQLTIRR